MRTILIAAALAACGGKGDTSCEDAVGHIARVSKNGVTASDKAVAACKQAWSAEMRRCILGATDDDGFVKCTREHVNVEHLKQVRDELKGKGADALRKHIRENGAEALGGSAMQALDPGGSRRVDTSTGSNQ